MNEAISSQLIFIFLLFGSFQKGASVADTVIGEGNTSAWRLCGLDKTTCLTVFFDISSSGSNTPGAANPQFYLQFLTRYFGQCFSLVFYLFFLFHLNFAFLHYIVSFIVRSIIFTVVYLIAVTKTLKVKHCSELLLYADSG